MDFLKEVNISMETINDLNVYYDKTLINTCVSKKDKVISGVKYLQELGIDNVEDILFENLRVFLGGRENMSRAMESLDKEDFIRRIQEDESVIEELIYAK